MDSNTDAKHVSSPRDLRNSELTVSSEDEMPLIRRSRQPPQQAQLMSFRKPDRPSPANFEQLSKQSSKQALPTDFLESNTSLGANHLNPFLRNMYHPSQESHTSSPKSIEPTNIEPPRIRKKPGPKPWAQRAISKNDTEAKMQVIRSIEKNWGKNFIYHYIPKCHRPLQKRGPGKRPTFRQHEAGKMFEFD